MTAAVDRGRITGRVALAVGLIVLNLGLLALNLERHDVLPFSLNRETTAVDGDAAAPDDGDSGGAGTDGTEPISEDSVATDTSLATSSTTMATDADWPGGTGEVPQGPPVPRVARITADGRLELTGSAPSWNTALQIVEFAGANLPGGAESVDNNLTWHPEASTDTQSGIVVIDQAASFQVGGAEIDPASTQSLNLTAEILKSRPSLFVVVVGHTDDVGDEDVNAALALQRANAVVGYLIEQGVVPGQLVVASAGEDDPFASNDTAEGRESNRRIELRFENFLIPPQTFGLSE